MNTLSSLLKNLRNRTPVATVQMFAGNTVPTDWLLCNGQAVSRETFSALFSAIGTTYGAGDGSTTFNVPNLQGRVVVGSGTNGSVTYSLGGTGGSKDAIVPKHSHDFTNPAYKATGGAVNYLSQNTGGMSANRYHGHTIYTRYTKDTAGGSARNRPDNDGANITDGGRWTSTADLEHVHSMSHSHGFTQPTISVTTNGVVAEAGTEVDNANMMPYVSCNYIIYAGKTAN